MANEISMSPLCELVPLSTTSGQKYVTGAMRINRSWFPISSDESLTEFFVELPDTDISFPLQPLINEAERLFNAATHAKASGWHVGSGKDCLRLTSVDKKHVLFIYGKVRENEKRFYGALLPNNTLVRKMNESDVVGW